MYGVDDRDTGDDILQDLWYQSRNINGPPVNVTVDVDINPKLKLDNAGKPFPFIRYSTVLY